MYCKAAESNMQLRTYCRETYIEKLLQTVLATAKNKINMSAETSEYFKHKLHINAGSKFGTFLTLNTLRLNYDNQPANTV
jgi:hypothetical protein